MKYLIFILTLTIGLLANNLQAQIINIPDPELKKILIYQVDQNDDGEIQESEALAVKVLNLTDGYDGEILTINVSDLTGIEYFKNLTYLKIENSKITNLNLSTLTKLEELSCSNNKIVNLNIENSNNLKNLNCYNNKIISLDLSNMVDLERLQCTYNQLKILKINNSIKLKRVQCSVNQLTDLSINNLHNLESLECTDNKLTSLYINNAPKLTNLYCYNNLLTSLELSNVGSLIQLECYNNQLTNIDVSNLKSLTFFAFHSNLLTSINLNELTNLNYLNCSSNQLTMLDVSMLGNLTNLDCSSNQLTKLDLSMLRNLTGLNCSSNLLKTLDVSMLRELGIIIAHSNPFEYIYIKNKKPNSILNSIGDTIVYIFKNVPNLKSVCTDGNEVPGLRKLANNEGYSKVRISSSCSVTSAGAFDQFVGKVRLDLDNNGCSISDNVYPNLKIKLNNETKYVISGKDGNFYAHLDTDTITFYPILDNTNYFTVNPSNFTLIAPFTSSPSFCVIPKGSFNDLSVALIPTFPARPGFSNSTYKVVYKNQGTTTQSGSVSLSYDESKMNFISASPTADNISDGNISFDFSDLAPFETRSAIITMRTNSPMDNPAVNSGDVLEFTAVIVGATDETPEDNLATLNQTVVGSYDPNDKTCLEGDIITPDLVGKNIHYLIRFENTGTAPAENIMITDFIDTTVFDINTLLVSDASHICYTQISDGNKVQFVFNDIQLPFTEPDKHGFVAFNIQLKDNLQIGDSIKNKANIYFDYNLPVATNEAISEVNNRTVTAIQQKISDISLSIYPNPSKGNFNLNVKSNSIELVQISVLDIEGKVIFAKSYKMQQGNIPIQLEKLAKGTYLIQAKVSGEVVTKKMVIQ